MKKILAFITPLILLIAIGCSKEHDKPIFSLFENLAKPAIVDAVFDSVSASVKLVWTISDTTGVKQFIVTSSDSSLFNSGNRQSITCTEDSLVYLINNYHATSIKPLTLYFTVSAVFKTDKLNWFVGPQSDIVSKIVRY